MAPYKKTRINSTPSSESFSLVEPTGTRQINDFMRMRWLKQIHGNMNNNFPLMEMKFQSPYLPPLWIWKLNILFRD